MGEPDDLRRRLAELAELGKAVVEDEGPPEAASKGGGTSANSAFPVVRRESPRHPRHPWTEPLRRNIDYQSTSRKSLLVPPFQCGECGGGLWAEDEHKKDLGACEDEKIRQIMES